jgi:hypothetical protein
MTDDHVCRSVAVPVADPYRGGAPTAEQVDVAVRQALAVAPARLTERAMIDLAVNILGSAAHPNAVLISRQLVQERLAATGWVGWQEPGGQEPTRSLQDRVRAFHEQFGFHVGTDPTQPPPDQIRYERAGLLAEEVAELITELTRGLPSHLIVAIELRFRAKLTEAFVSDEEPYDPLKLMREAGDVHVGLLGLAVNVPFDLDRATGVVCDSNVTRSGPDERGMAFKGEGFVAPDMRRALPEEAGRV